MRPSKIKSPVSFVTIVLLSFLSMSITSCVSMKFETIQPVNSVSMLKFPGEFHGKYIDSECDTLIITECCIQYGSGNFLYSAESIVLKKGEFELTQMDEDYFLNLKTDNHWDVIFIKMDKGSFAAYYIDFDTLIEDYHEIGTDSDKERLVIERIGKITNVKKHHIDDDEYYLLNPSVDELKNLISSGIFVKMGDFKRI